MQELYGTDFKLARIWVKENIMPLGTEKVALLGAASGGDANYFGDGSDGSVTTSGDVTYTVANKNGSYDGDMYVANYTALTISTGDTITVDQPCKGVLIYVTGNCTINGTLTMSSKGASYTSTQTANPIDSSTDTIWMPMFTASAGSQDLTVAAPDFSNAGSAATTAVANQPGIAGDGTLFTISGAAGGARGSGSNGTFSGSAGAGGTLSSASYEMWCQNGGGGGGGAKHASVGSATGGVGGASNWPGGGAGGGGAGVYHSGGYGGEGTAGGGAGGTGVAVGPGTCGGGGGAGNPGGGGAGINGGSGSTGGTGTGGIIWLIVGGDLTFGASSVITSIGTAGGGAGGTYSAGGAGSGSGSAHIIYAGTLSDGGVTYTFAGGSGSSPSGAGGVGSYLVTQVA